MHTKLLALLMLCCLPAAAMAYDEGAYVALNGGVSEAVNDCPPPGVPGNCGMHRAHAYFVTYGYQYTPTWGLEVNFGKTGYISASNFNVRPIGLSVSGVATVHMGDSLSVFAKAGVTYTDFNIVTAPPNPGFNTNGTSPSGGLGVQYEFTPKFALRLQADYFGSYQIFSGATRVRMLAGTIGLMSMY